MRALGKAFRTIAEERVEMIDIVDEVDDLVVNEKPSLLYRARDELLFQSGRRLGRLCERPRAHRRH